MVAGEWYTAALPLPAIGMGSPQVNPGLIRFGVFEADLNAGELRRSGAKVRLQDLPFRALVLLLSRPGDVITREEIRRSLWPPDVFVDFEQGISSAIMRLRTALKDSAENPIFVETVGRRGYRWIAPIHEDKPTAFNVALLDATPALVAQSPASAWRKLLYLVPVIALLVVGWAIRAGWRKTYAHNKEVVGQKHTPHQPANSEAEDAYLKGRYLCNKRTADSLNQAVDAFTQAIVHDPNYADAYVGLADSFNLLREFSAMNSSEAYTRGIAAVKKAIELDPQSSDAHATFAFDLYWGQWDIPSAEKEFRRAIELDPSNAKAHHWFATFLDSIGRRDEALQEIGIARKLDPTSPAIMADQGELLQMSGRRDEAIQLLRQLEKTDPDFVSPHRYLWQAYFYNQDYPHFIAELREDGRLSRDRGTTEEAQAAERGFTRDGELGMFKAMLPVQKKLYEQGKLSPYFVAFSAIHLGNKQEALEYLKIMVESHDAYSIAVSRDVNFTSLHGDPLYEALMEQVASASGK